MVNKWGKIIIEVSTLNSRGFTLIELLAVIVVIGIIATLAVPSYNTVSLAIKESHRDNIIKEIETKAALYAKDTGKTIIFVDELITEGYIDLTDDGDDIKDPLNDGRMNCYLVEMEKVNDYYKATFIDNNYDSDTGCDLTKLNEAKEDLQIEVQSGEKIGDFYKGSVTLKALSSTLNIDCVSSRCVWTSSSGANYQGLDTININNISGVLKSTYTFQLTKINNETKDILRYTDSINLNIDNESPIIYKDEIYVTDKFINTSSKKVTIEASDGYGSGIAGYSLVLGDVNCNNINIEYQQENKFTVTSNGTYTVCVKDKVENTSKTNLVINYIS